MCCERVDKCVSSSAEAMFTQGCLGKMSWLSLLNRCLTWLQHIRTNLFLEESILMSWLLPVDFLSLLTTSVISDHSLPYHWGLLLSVGIVREISSKVSCKAGFCEEVFLICRQQQGRNDRCLTERCLCACLGLQGLGDWGGNLTVK